MADTPDQDFSEIEETFDDEDIRAVGSKVIEMAERLKVCNAALPGSQAVWAFTLDGCRYEVTVQASKD